MSRSLQTILKTLEEGPWPYFTGTTQPNEAGKPCEGYPVAVNEADRNVLKQAGYRLTVCYSDDAIKQHGVFKLAAENAAVKLSALRSQGEKKVPTQTAEESGFEVAHHRLTKVGMRAKELKVRRALLTMKTLDVSLVSTYMEVPRRLNGHAFFHQAWSPLPKYKALLSRINPPSGYQKISYHKGKDFVFVREGIDASYIRDILKKPKK